LRHRSRARSRFRLLGGLVYQLGRDVQEFAQAIVVPPAFVLRGAHLLVGRMLADIGVLHIRDGVLDLLIRLALARRGLFQDLFLFADLLGQIVLQLDRGLPQPARLGDLRGDLAFGLKPGLGDLLVGPRLGIGDFPLGPAPSSVRSRVSSAPLPAPRSSAPVWSG
jgi:hypothetical protein